MVHLLNTYKIKEVRLIMVRNKLYLNSCLTSLTFVISAIVVKDRLSTSPNPTPQKQKLNQKENTVVDRDVSLFCGVAKMSLFQPV